MIKYFKWWLKMKYQKVTRGYTDYEIWNLDCTFIDWTLPRLKMFKCKNKCHPIDLTAEEWDIILDKMIKAFELYRQEPGDDITQLKKDNRAIEEGFKLFGERMRNLWW